MDRIDWDISLDTGDSTVDAQHRELINMLNSLRESETNGDLTTIPTTLAGLSAFVGTHFGCEYDLMVKHAMPGEFVAAHVAEHRVMTDRTRDFVMAFRRGEISSVEPLIEFLWSWLDDHIERMDRELVQHMRVAG